MFNATLERATLAFFLAMAATPLLAVAAANLIH